MSNYKHKATACNCPFNGFPCRERTCAIWDDHWRCCSLHRDSLSGTVRTSVCDAAVEVIRAYRLTDERRPAHG